MDSCPSDGVDILSRHYKTVTASHIYPGDANYALTKLGNCLECTQGEINRVAIATGRASVGDSDDNGLAVGRVGNLDLFTTKV